MKDILRKSLRKRNPCRKTWGWEKRWEDVRVLKAFLRGVREVSGWNDLASSFLSRPWVERSSCPDAVILRWREFSPVFGKGPRYLYADGLINSSRFRNSSWATSGEKKKTNRSSHRLSVLIAGEFWEWWSRKARCDALWGLPQKWEPRKNWLRKRKEAKDSAGLLKLGRDIERGQIFRTVLQWGYEAVRKLGRFVSCFRRFGEWRRLRQDGSTGGNSLQWDLCGIRRRWDKVVVWVLGQILITRGHLLRARIPLGSRAGVGRPPRYRVCEY
jgi:hypothetical protein